MKLGLLSVGIMEPIAPRKEKTSMKLTTCMTTIPS